MSSILRWPRTAWDFVFEVGKRWYYGGLGDLAASVTFWILLTLPAAILAMVSALGSLDTLLGQNLSDEIEADVTSWVERVFTSDAEVVAAAVRQLFQQQNSGLLTFSLLIAFWTISRGFSGLIRSLDDVHEVEDGRPWYLTRVVGLFLGLGSLLVPVPIVLLEVFVWSGVPDGAVEALLRSISGVTILVFWASMIFHFGPSIRTRWRWELPGAFVAAVGWWLLTEGFRYYVDFSTGRNEVLTAIGATFLALTWVWLAAQVLLVGAAVNSILGDRLGLDRDRREWNIPEVIFRTGEMKKIVLPERDETRPEEPAPEPFAPSPVNRRLAPTPGPAPTPRRSPERGAR